jgi:hypothetical protein
MRTAAAIVLTATLSAFIAVLSVELSQEAPVECDCFGGIERAIYGLQNSTASSRLVFHFTVDVLLLLMAVMIMFFDRECSKHSSAS